MAARVEADDVRLIFNTELSNAQLDVFIISAHLMVEEKITKPTATEELKKELERWLAAHFAASADPLHTSMSLGDEFSETIQGRFGMYLESTSYGQRAVTLDTTGSLAGTSRKKAIIDVHSEWD